jgi:hypothetical protein
MPVWNIIKALERCSIFSWVWCWIFRWTLCELSNDITICSIISNLVQGPSWPSSYGNWIYNYLCNQYLSPLVLWVGISIMAMCTTLCDKVCQWLATGRWFSPGPPVYFTNHTDRHDITEILLKVVLNTNKQTKPILYTGEQSKRLNIHNVRLTNM